ncbi:MAG: PPOX class F420-dependent oxidoreductase, partial [Anaerolineales bacterium]
MLSEKEIQYLQSQRLARLATVAPNGQPDVVPVGFAFDGTYFFVGGRDVPNTRKYRNVVSGHTQVALTIDDLETVQPWKPRGVR